MGLHEPAVLAVDAGQTGVRIGHFVADECHRSWSLPGVRGDINVADQVGALVVDVLDTIGEPRPGVLCVGASGLAGVQGASRLLASVHSLGVSRVFAAHDSVSSYLGAIGWADGVVIAAGTGVVALACGPTEAVRLDGWGHLLGDAGSAYWIGRCGLDAVLRGFDGRAGGTELAKRLPTDMLPLETVYLCLQQDPSRVRRIAGLAPLVTELSASDEVCRGIVEAAANELAHTVLTGLRRVIGQGSASTSVGLVGNVFRSDEIRNGVVARITSVFPQVNIRVGGDSLLGAKRFTGVPRLSPMGVLIDAAESRLGAT